MDTLQYTNGWLNLENNRIDEINHFCEDYKHFLNAGKTERQCVKASIAEAEQHASALLKSLNN